MRLIQEELEQARESGTIIDNPEAREKIAYGENRDAYWTGDKCIAQVERVNDIAKIKYPDETHTVVFIFDQSAMADVVSCTELVACPKGTHTMECSPN